MSDFKGRHFEGEIVLWAVRWYCRYGVSYRDLEQMMGERGVLVDHSTIYRWAQRYAPEIEKRLRWQWRPPRSTSWRVDETYVKVRGQWAYLYRALDKHGKTIDFYLSPTRTTAAAKRFIGKALNGLKGWERPRVINTDKAPTYAAALAQLKQEGRCPADTQHQQVKVLNNVIEADHGKLKQLIRPVRGFKTLKTAYATIKGFEVMRALRKGQASAFNVTRDIRGEARIVERAFGIGASALAEAAYWRGAHLDKSLAMPPHRAGPDAYVTAHILVDLLKAATVEQMIAWTSEPKFLPVIPFGKHRGTKWDEAPIDYLQWMSRQTDMDPDAIWCAREALSRRATQA